MSGSTLLALPSLQELASKSPGTPAASRAGFKWARLAARVGLMVLAATITVGWMRYHRRVVVLACYRSDEAPPAGLEPVQIPPAPATATGLDDDLGTWITIEDAWIVELKVAAPLAFREFVKPTGGHKAGFRYDITSEDFTLLDESGLELPADQGFTRSWLLVGCPDLVDTDLAETPVLRPRLWIRVRAIFPYRCAKRPYAIQFRGEPPVRLP